MQPDKNDSRELPRFVYMQLATLQDVRKQIQECEGRHIQQAIYSTYMDTLTQVCFTERMVRSNRWDTVPAERREEGVDYDKV